MVWLLYRLKNPYKDFLTHFYGLFPYFGMIIPLSIL